MALMYPEAANTCRRTKSVSESRGIGRRAPRSFAYLICEKVNLSKSTNNVIGEEGRRHVLHLVLYQVSGYVTHPIDIFTYSRYQFC